MISVNGEQVLVSNEAVVPCRLRVSLITVTEEPQPSLHCRRKNGYFAHEDPHICDKFYYCVDGKFNMISCPDGLVYNERTGSCTWPDEAKKKGCSSEGEALTPQPTKFFCTPEHISPRNT
jgi:hypothetical protein